MAPPPKDPLAHILAQGKRDPQIRLHKPEAGVDPEAMEMVDPRHYQAFETGQRPARLIIQCSRGPSHSPAYNLLINIIYDRRFGSSFVLVFNFMAVTVLGRNLAPVVHAINHHRCVNIMEFDAKAFDAPVSDAPVIERIEVQASNAMNDQITTVANYHPADGAARR